MSQGEAARPVAPRTRRASPMRERAGTARTAKRPPADPACPRQSARCCERTVSHLPRRRGNGRRADGSAASGRLQRARARRLPHRREGPRAHARPRASDAPLEHRARSRARVRRESARAWIADGMPEDEGVGCSNNEASSGKARVGTQRVAGRRVRVRDDIGAHEKNARRGRRPGGFRSERRDALPLLLEKVPWGDKPAHALAIRANAESTPDTLRCCITCSSARSGRRTIPRCSARRGPRRAASTTLREPQRSTIAPGGPARQSLSRCRLTSACSCRRAAMPTWSCRSTTTTRSTSRSGAAAPRSTCA